MRRAVLVSLFACFAIGLTFGQAVVTSGGFVTMQGPAIVTAPAWPPLLITPQAQLSTVLSSPIGITNQGRGGISIADRGLMAPPPPSHVTVPILTNPGVFAVQPVGSETEMQPESAKPEGEAAETREGTGFGTADSRHIGLRGMRAPLGSVIEGKGAARPPAVHTYTNSDMQRLESNPQTHVSIVGMNTPAEGTSKNR